MNYISTLCIETSTLHFITTVIKQKRNLHFNPNTLSLYFLCLSGLDNTSFNKSICPQALAKHDSLQKPAMFI